MEPGSAATSHRSLTREAAAKIEAPQISAGIAAPIIPPTVPGASAAPSAPVAPPMPGQLNALPAAPPEKIVPSRIPDMPVPETSRVPTTPLTKNNLISSTSTSGQFIVHGNDLSLRSAFSSRCEEVSQELSQLLTTDGTGGTRGSTNRPLISVLV